MNKEVRRLKLELIMEDEPDLRKVINFLDGWFIGTVKEERKDDLIILLERQSLGVYGIIKIGMKKTGGFI
jgi:hypothetical protein